MLYIDEMLKKKFDIQLARFTILLFINLVAKSFIV